MIPVPSQRPLRLAPSILNADIGRLAELVAVTERAGADWIHLDIMDGHFVPNITFGPPIVAAVRAATDLPLDVHLMIEAPDRYLEDFAQAGADLLTVHVETCPHLHRTVQQILDLGCKAGVALNPATPVESVREIAPFLDMILVMTVNPGFGGQQFIPTSTSKIQRMRKLLDEFNPICDLEIDGGIGVHNAGEMVQQGANVIVAGSAIYNEDATVAENVRTLRQAMTSNAT